MSLRVLHLYFSETTLSPGRELGFNDFFAFDLAPFAAAQFTGVGLPWIFYFFHLKIDRREVLFCFGRPLLWTASAVGAAVAGGSGAIYCGLMLDV